MNAQRHGSCARWTLEVSGLCVEVARRCLVQDLEFTASPGQFIAILGENGVGKTLTLHTLAGLRRPAAGSVRLGRRDLAAWPRRELARARGLLAQSSEDPFPVHGARDGADRPAPAPGILAMGERSGRRPRARGSAGS